MSLSALPLLLWGALAAALAGSETQTDWSGGTGVTGPVWSWESSFENCNGIDWIGSSGSLRLGIQTTFHPITSTGLRTVWALTHGDVDGDGDPDVIGSWLENLAWWENSGYGGSWYVHLLDRETTTSLASADIDGDGYIDVVGAVPDRDRICWWQNPAGPGNLWFRRKVCSFARASLVLADDIDGDGDMDVAGGGYQGLAWWENRDGTGTDWEYRRIADMIYHLQVLDTGDIDGDSDLDVVSADGRSIRWWENDRPHVHTWNGHVVDLTCNSVVSITVIDLDEDGDDDIVAAYGGRYLSWWENTDSEGLCWTEHPVGGVDSVRTSFAADLDGDGDIDIAAGGTYSGSFCWYENVICPDSGWVRHDVGEELALKLVPSDVNYDGIPEVIGATQTGPVWPYYFEVRWYDLFGFVEDGILVSSILCADCPPAWDSLEWTSDEPEGTSVRFRVRASESYGYMGPWSPEIQSPGSLEGILGEGCRYFQYAACLYTDDQSLSPVLQEVSVSWDSSGAETGPGVEQVYPYSLMPVAPNPSYGSVTVDFSIPGEAFADLVVYDLSGRTIGTAFSGIAPSGWSRVEVSGLVPGVYILRMRSGSFSDTVRFAVIE